MSRPSSDILDLAQLFQVHLTELPLAARLDELLQRGTAALGALLPAHETWTSWLTGGSAVALPDELTLARLRAGEIVAAESSDIAAVPLRAGGDLLGWISIRPAQWSSEQDLGLRMLATILAPTYLAFSRAVPPPVPLEQRRAALRPGIARLRDASAVTPLLHEICDLVQAALPFQYVAFMLRYRDSDWIEMAYLSLSNQALMPRLYWRAVEGLSGVVITSGEPLYTDSYSDECLRRGLTPLDIDTGVVIHRWVGVPLRDNGLVYGALIAFSDTPDVTLSADDQELLHWLATELARPIRGAQRYERAASESSQRKALNVIARLINSSLDPEHVTGVIVERAPVLLNAEECSLLLLDEATGELVFRYAAGPAGHQLLGQRLPAGKGVAGYVVSSGRAEIVNNTRNDGRFYGDLDGNTGFITRSILAVPLRGIDGVKGVIEVLNRNDNAPFTDEDRELLEALADQAMIALENARRFASLDQTLTRRVQELDRSNDRMRQILRASNALRAELPINDVLQQIAGIVCESSGFRSAMISLTFSERMPEPYLRRVAAAGPALAHLDRLSTARAPLSGLDQLLRPEYRRGNLTYLIDHQHDDFVKFWGGPEAIYRAEAPVAEGGDWHPGDTIFSLLRNSRGELLGLLGVAEPEDGMRPSAEQVQILEILANQAAAAIENAHLYAGQQASLNHMLALNALGRAISTTLRSPRQIYELTTRGMQELSDAHWAMVFLGDPPDAALNLVFQTGTTPRSPAAAAQLAREAITARRPINMLPEGISEGMVGIPLRGSSRSLGAICVGFGDGTVSPAELETLILFASQAASAVESLQLLAEVRQGHMQLASIMASTREGILLVDEAGRIAVANGALIMLANTVLWPEPATTPEALAGLPLDRLLERWQAQAGFTSREQEKLLSGIKAVADGDESYMRGQLSGLTAGAPALEWSVLRATREGDEALVPHGRSGPPWPLLLTVRDITAAKEAERLRNDLTNMMVHDLRSPLTSIMTSIDMIFRGITGDVTKTQREILTIAYTSAQSLLNMVNLLLDISRLEGGLMPLDRVPLTAEGLVERVIARMNVIAQSKAITIVPAIDEVPDVLADGDLMLRVLQNLLDNALKFSPKGSTVTITVAGTPPPSDSKAVPMVRFAVRDMGIGIKPGDREKIFTKFGQAGTRRSLGSGLGLTFCKLVVEAHGGQIWVESAPGEGSTFFFILPASSVV